MVLKIACRASDEDKHSSDISFLLYNNGKLYSGADDGKIKIWTPDLKKTAEVDAHQSSVFGLAANEDTLFSCSNDGTIKAWGLDTLNEKGTITQSDELEFWRVGWSAGVLFSGDDRGNIKVYKDNKFFGEADINEPVKNLAIREPFTFSVHECYLVVTEIKIEEKVKASVRMQVPGKAPLTLIGDNLFAFTSKNGKEVQVHLNSPTDGFKQVAKLPLYNDTINALEGVKWGDEEQLFLGGWDKVVRKWKITNNTPKNEGSVEVENMIYAIATGEKNQVYVGCEGGYIERVDVS